MNWRAFGTGAGIGVVSAAALSSLTTLFFKWIPGTNLVNFGPAIFGFGLLVAEMILAGISLIVALISLFRRRWKCAGFALALSLVIAGWYGAWFLLAG